MEIKTAGEANKAVANDKRSRDRSPIYIGEIENTFAGEEVKRIGDGNRKQEGKRLVGKNIDSPS